MSKLEVERSLLEGQREGILKTVVVYSPILKFLLLFKHLVS